MSAVGGGMILGKGIATIQIPILKSGSLLAFFVGTVFGLILLQFTPKQFSKRFSRWFSICGGITSLVLLSIFILYQTNETLSGKAAILFFILLSIRFGFWFYSRVLRASDAAGQQQSIAWVEFGYYAGVILGLILWLLLGIDIGMSSALLLDAFLQIFAGLLDFSANNIKTTFLENENSNKQTVMEHNQQNEIISNNYDKIWGWRLAISVMLLTVGVQVIIFSLAHQVSNDFSPYMLAIFYLGAAFSSIFCKKFNVRLEWNLLLSTNRGYAAILFGKTEHNKGISFLLLNILAALSVAATVIITMYLDVTQIKTLNIAGFWLLSFIFISTFFYGIIELAILDRIGLEEKNSSNRGMVLRTYGIMSIAAAISLWLLEMVHGAIFYLLATLIICFMLTFFSIWKRSSSINDIL